MTKWPNTTSKAQWSEAEAWGLRPWSWVAGGCINRYENHQLSYAILRQFLEPGRRSRRSWLGLAVDCRSVESPGSYKHWQLVAKWELGRDGWESRTTKSPAWWYTIIGQRQRQRSEHCSKRATNQKRNEFKSQNALGFWAENKYAWELATIWCSTKCDFSMKNNFQKIYSL